MGETRILGSVDWLIYLREAVIVVVVIN